MIRVQAYAKINLFLEITGKREDGYHSLSTVFQTISLADELTFRAADRITLTCSDPSLSTDESNLVMKAALAVQTELKEKKGVAMTLQKRIPMGAGLGGGSSDAAAVLKTLPVLWERKLSPAILQRLARRLGADVPFFLNGGSARGEGIGDELTALKALPKTWLILVYPGFGVSTKEAYARVRVPVQDPQSIDLFLKSLSGGDWASKLFNRFESFVFPSHPELPKLGKAIVAAGAMATIMSGSGSTMVGVVRSPAIGRQVMGQLLERYPQSFLVHTVPAGGLS